MRKRSIITHNKADKLSLICIVEYMSNNDSSYSNVWYRDVNVAIEWVYYRLRCDSMFKHRVYFDRVNIVTLRNIRNVNAHLDRKKDLRK